jgi:protein-tyrosine phosphatase
MIPETYYIKDIAKGGLAIMPKPRGKDWLEDEIKGLKNLGYELVVSFLEKSEEIELQLTEERSFCEQSDIEFVSFPIPDRGVPDDKEFLNLVSKLYQKIFQGKKAILHCWGGIGRAGITASSILIKHGLTGEEAFQKVSEARGLQVPDTKEQKLWVLNIEHKLKIEQSVSPGRRGRVD